MSFPSSIAALIVALSGVLLMLGCREAALRLFVVGVLIACGAPVIEGLFRVGSRP